MDSSETRGAGEIDYAVPVPPPQPLSDRTRELMAIRFRALGEPTRLRILERLFRSPASVSEILRDVGGGQANISKHLAVLRSGGLVRRRREGSLTIYWIADASLERICAAVCDAIGRDALLESEAAGASRPRTRRA